MTQIIDPDFVTPAAKLRDEVCTDGAEPASHQNQHGPFFAHLKGSVNVAGDR